MEIIIDLLLELIIQVPMARVLALTIVPAFALLHFVRKRDWLEPESPRLVWSLFGIGVLSVIAAFVLEMFGMSLFLRLMDSQTVAFNLIHWFVIVGLAEEGSKYTLMRLRTWNNPEFDCMYDGVVYAVAVSAGFALAENVMYLIRYGGSVVLMRALVSIPGHISFAVFMGVFYAAAKKCRQFGSERGEIVFQLLALFVPALLHGLFDLAADSIKSRDIALFYIIVAIMFVISWILVRRFSERDHYIVEAVQQPDSPAADNAPVQISQGYDGDYDVDKL